MLRGGPVASRTLVIVGAGLAALACAGRAAPTTAATPVPAGRSDSCALLTPASSLPDSLWIAVADPLESANASIARASAQLVAFPPLHSSNGRIDCNALPIAMPDTAIGTTPHATPSEVSSARELRVSRIAAAAGRDALDAGVDVLITTDAATIAYAAQRSDLGSVPLPWDRVYLLIEPASPARLVPDTARAFRGGLALDVARVDAQPVDPRQWGDMTEMCPVAASPSETAVGPRPSMAVPSRRIVYDRRDDVARALSERLVALADTRPVSTASRSAASELLRAAGLDSTELAGALATGLDAGYVLALPIRVSDFCRSTGAMLAEAPWLPLGDGTTADRIVPLVMTRPHAIVRAAWMGLSAEWLGDVFLEFGHPSSP